MGWGCGRTIYCPSLSPAVLPLPPPTSSPPPSTSLRQNLIKKPLEIWPRVAMGIARSSLFLTLFIAAGFGGTQIMGPSSEAFITSLV